MRVRARPLTVVVASGMASVALSLATGSVGFADEGGNGQQGDQGGGPLAVTTILSGTSLTHSFTPAGSSTPKTETLSKPDDITRLGDNIFVGFQNGVGPQGEASSSGNLDSTVVETTLSGQPVGQWDIAGKDDGLTADPELGSVIATANEDGNSSLYTITPGGGGTVQHFTYNEPLPHFGGTDAISILHGQILISASAPGTTGGQPAPQPTYPAVYSVTLDHASSVATVTPVFFDEDPAVVANVGTSQSGQTMNLALTDPDSNEIVPWDAARFQGQFMLTSQGDQQQIFLGHDHNGSDPKLSVLNLSQAVDDTAWPNSDGTLYATDSTNDAIDAVTGGFPENPVVAVTPCGSNAAPASCPAPPQFPANYLGTLNPWTGQVHPLTTTGAAIVPQGGLLFVPRGDNGNQGGQRFESGHAFGGEGGQG
jgi:hypothetical protein